MHKTNQRPYPLRSLTLLVLLLAGFIQAKAQQPAWNATGALGTARTQHTATLLANGKVLVVGGLNASAPISSAELYDPATGRWSATGNPRTPRYGHAAVRLASGKVLIVGGITESLPPTNAEVYDPDTGAWSDAGNPRILLLVPRAVLLADGKVLVAGGLSFGGEGQAVVYDPATNAWIATGATNVGRLFHSINLLPDGRVLLAGGFIVDPTPTTGGRPLRTAEIYDPATNRWTLTSDLTIARFEHQAILLTNGKVLVVGGITDGPAAATSAELYDPATGQWSATGNPTTFRVWHTLTLLPDGKVLAAGGSIDNSAELYDPATGSWTLTAAPGEMRLRHTATLLPNGKVLVAGGANFPLPGSSGAPLASAELFDSGTPAIANISAASFIVGPLAPEAITAAFGVNLAARTQSAAGLPLPTRLAGVEVRVRDSLSVERLAPLFFAAPGQINYQIPAGTASGQAIVTITSGGNLIAAGSAVITNVAPGLFSANANGQGVAAAVALRNRANGEQRYESVAQFDATNNRVVPIPIELSNPSEQVFLLLFGTGLRHRTALSNVTAKIGGLDAEVLFAGAQGDLVGLDQINLRLPNTLAGRGEVSIVLTVDGKATNAVTVHLR